MQVSVTFKNLDSSDSLKNFVEEKLSKFDKLFDGHVEAAVILSVEKFRNTAEITLTGDKLKINGKEETEDMYSAIDLVLDKIEKQIKKNKQKVKDHHRASSRRSKNTSVVKPE
ncbi:MAG: ribosome hibernation-promoting factor, HPF/YfiA family [Desulfosudaceae bacterium]